MFTRIELLAQRLSQRLPAGHASPLREQAAVALILGSAEEHSPPELLLIRRSERAGDPWSGHMALPGGRRETRDIDLRATAMREAREETGVDLSAARLLGRLDDIRPIRQSERALSVRPFVYWAKQRPELELSNEVAEAFWIPLEELEQSVGEAGVEHRGAQLRVPAYLVKQRVVWGMTQRVLSALLDLARL